MDIVIRDVPEPLLSNLSKVADKNGVSLSDIALITLKREYGQDQRSPEETRELLAQIEALHKEMSCWIMPEQTQAAIREGRE